MTAKEITISNTASKNMAELISLACSFNSRIILENSHFSINAKSLMGIMAFTPMEGNPVNIVVTGNDEQEALSAVESFLTQK